MNRYTKGDVVGAHNLIFIKEVNKHIQPDGTKHRCAMFLCECGEEFITQIASVRLNRTKSCGCLRKETTRETGKRRRKNEL